MGAWLVNDINFADGRAMHNIMGGSLFAFCGMLQYTADAVFLGAVGNDVEEKFGDWLNKNNVCRDGLVYYDNPTTLATMFYKPNGEWHETFQYGPIELGYDINFRGPILYDKMEEIFSQKKTKGVYAANKIKDDGANEKIDRIRKAYGIKVMLELYTDDCQPEYLEHFVNKTMHCYDIYSLNRTESYTFFGVKTEDEAIERILKLGVPCYYRVGSKGSYTIMNGKVAFMPTVNLVPKEQEVDPTGCGNNSTAAALWGFCEGYNVYEIASIGNVAAAYNVQQYGPYPTFNDRTRKASLELALQLAKQAQPSL